MITRSWSGCTAYVEDALSKWHNEPDTRSIGSGCVVFLERLVAPAPNPRVNLTRLDLRRTVAHALGALRPFGADPFPCACVRIF